MIEKDDELDVVELSEDKRYLHLLDKVKLNEVLSRREIGELRYHKKRRAKRGKKRRKVVA